MDSIKDLFWNDEERRLRALWRLLLQGLLMVVVTTPLQLVLGIAIAVALVSDPGFSPEQLGDVQAVQEFMFQSPVLMVLSTVTMLLAFTVSIWLAGRFLDRRPFADFGFHLDRGWWLDLGFGLFLGAFLMGLVFLVEWAAGWLSVAGTFVTRNPATPFPLAILGPLFTFLAVGFYEELFSRGYQLQNLAEGFNGGPVGPRVAIWIAAILSAAVFGLLHVLNPNASFISTFNIFLAGVFLLGFGYMLTGELAIPIGVHITWNFFQGNVFGFPVSGTNYGAATFIAINQRGPALWTGGAFGPEAGLIGLLAMGLGALLTVLWVRWRHGRVGLYLPLARPPEPVQEEVPELEV
jgi:hypothetical protein